MSESVYLDTNVLVYAIENHPEYGASCKKILQDIQDNKLRTSASIQVLAELVNVLVKLNKVLGKEKIKLNIQENIEAVLSLPIVWLELNFTTILKATEYTYAINGADYIHLASMEIHGIKKILSADSDFDKPSEIKRINPLEY